MLATLGYGDAIGHEVLGIQRVLRGAGYESEIFVETADPRLEDLTVDYRDLPDASHPDNILIHHFSIGSRASRIAYALPDRMVLVYHNITPPEYFVDVHPLLVQQCFLGRRELGFYATRCDLGARRFRIQPPGARGARLSAPPACCPVVPDFSHLSGPPNYMQAGAFDDDWVNLLFVGRTIPNKRIEDVIRWFHAYKRWFNPRSRLLLVGSQGGFERYLAMLHQLIARIGATDVHFLGHVTNEELVAYYEIADVFLCASEHEGFCVPLDRGVSHGRAGHRLRRHGRAGHDGRRRRARDRQGSGRTSRRSSIRSSPTPRSAGSHRLRAGRRARSGWPAKDFGGTLLRFVDQVQQRPAARRILRSRSISGIRCSSPRSSRRSGCIGPAAFQALPKDGARRPRPKP